MPIDAQRVRDSEWALPNRLKACRHDDIEFSAAFRFAAASAARLASLRKNQIVVRCGFTASAFSHERHEELLDGIRSKAGKRESRDGPLDAVLTKFGSSSDMVAVVGWNVETDPGILVPGKALLCSEGFLREAFPDGFVVCDQPLSRLLIVDFDGADFGVEEIRFDVSG